MQNPLGQRWKSLVLVPLRHKTLISKISPTQHIKEMQSTTLKQGQCQYSKLPFYRWFASCGVWGCEACSLILTCFTCGTWIPTSLSRSPFWFASTSTGSLDLAPGPHSDPFVRHSGPLVYLYSLWVSVFDTRKS